MRWPRYAEILLGVWLAASTFLLGPTGPASVAADLVLAAAVILLAAWSCAGERRLHLLILAVAAGLVGWGWVASRAGPDPADQNRLLVGLLLAMFDVLPTMAPSPPPDWR